MKVTQDILEDIVKEIAQVINKQFKWFFTGSSAMTGELAEGSDIDIVVNQKVTSGMFNAHGIVAKVERSPARWSEHDEIKEDRYGPVYATIKGMKVNIIGIRDAMVFEQWRKATNICILLCKNDKSFMKDKSIRVKIFEILRKDAYDVTIQGNVSMTKKTISDVKVSFK